MHNPSLSGISLGVFCDDDDDDANSQSVIIIIIKEKSTGVTLLHSPLLCVLDP